MAEQVANSFAQAADTQQLGQQLLEAIRETVVNMQKIQELVEAGAALEEIDESNHWRTPLMLAIIRGGEGIAQLLIEHKATLEGVDAWGWNPLTLAVRYNRKKTVELLIEHGAALGGDLLEIAARSGHLDICRLLLDRGVDLDHQSQYGGTALITAVVNGRLDIVRLFLARGVAPDIQCEGGKTALDFARASSLQNAREIEAMIESHTKETWSRGVNMEGKMLKPLRPRRKLMGVHQ